MHTDDPSVNAAIANLERQDVAVFPDNFRKDFKPVPGKPGEFREVHRVDLIKRGSGASTPYAISALKQDQVLWPHIKPYYEAWLEGQEEPAEGTPIDTLPFIPPTVVPHLKNLHIKTAEHLAALNDADMERVGMGAVGWREKAKSYIEAKEGNAALVEAKQELTEELELRKQEIQELKDQVNQLVAESAKYGGRGKPQRPTAKE